MGTLKDGLFGGFTGRVGNVVGATWRDIYYVRSLPAKVNDPKTKGQVKQRSRFSVAMEFLKTITPFLRIGFQSYASGRMTAFNAAMSYNMKNAVKGVGQEVQLDFSKVRISRGDLSAVTGVKGEVTGGDLHVCWDGITERNARGDDITMLVAYNVEKKQSVYDINAGKRSASKAVLHLPSDWQGQALESFLAFKTADGSEVSDSVNF